MRDQESEIDCYCSKDEREHPPLGAVQIFNGQNHRGTDVSDSI